MTKTLIIIMVVVAVALGGWQVFEYWEKVSDEKDAEAKTAASSVVNNPDALAGMPPTYIESLHNAQQAGPDALGNWLKIYGPSIQDPKKAWIQLDYVLMLARSNPQEAKRVFNDVKDRVPPNSPVWPRVHDMEKTFQ